MKLSILVGDRAGFSFVHIGKSRSVDCDSENPATCGQSNYISIQSPGPTSVIVNQASASQESCTGSCNERQTLEAPDDIAATPAHPPVGPVNVRFPSTLFSEKPRSFSSGWYHTYPWNNQYAKTHAFAIHVVCLVSHLYKLYSLSYKSLFLYAYFLKKNHHQK